MKTDQHSTQRMDAFEDFQMRRDLIHEAGQLITQPDAVAPRFGNRQRLATFKCLAQLNLTSGVERLRRRAGEHTGRRQIRFLHHEQHQRAVVVADHVRITLLFDPLLPSYIVSDHPQRLPCGSIFAPRRQPARDRIRRDHDLIAHL